jgi:hypothetical protein
MLSLATGILAAERGQEVVLLALAEPAVSAYLHMPRVPNVTDFFEAGSLKSAEQKVGWGSMAVGLRVILGPARPRDGIVVQEQMDAFLATVRATYAFCLCDLPVLSPGRSVWVSEPLRQATDVVLVMTPTIAGVSATVEALATLHDVRANTCSEVDRVYIILNRRLAGGLAAQDFVDGVTGLWGKCPALVAELDASPNVSSALERGGLPDAVLGTSSFSRALRSLIDLFDVC